MSRRSEGIGLALAAYCVANGAFVATVAKLTTGSAQPLSIAFLTSAFGGLAVLGVLVARGKLGLLAVRRDLPALLAVGALGTALALLLFYSGAKRATAVETALCVQTEPLYALFGTRLLLGHPLTPQRVAAVAAIGAGIALALGTQPTSGWLGLALLLATPLAWQSSHWVALRALPVFDPLQLAGARYVFGTLVLLPLWLALEGPAGLPSGDELARLVPIVALQGAMLGFGGTLAWYGAVKRLDLTRTTAIVVPSVPIVSLVVSYLVLGEKVSAREAAGFALTAGGVLAFALAPSVQHVAQASLEGEL
jgi:drug/metabolite transporter (DMT)-like permease